MHVTIVSDIHGNRHALQAVLEDVAAGPAVEVWCLGDVVGYGADPNDCCELAREHCAVVLRPHQELEDEIREITLPRLTAPAPAQPASQAPAPATAPAPAPANR